MDRYFPAFVTLHKHGELEGAAAFAAWRPKEEIVTNNKQDILARIQVSVASRASEELFLDVNLSGVAGDFASATALAANYIGVYGMDGTISSYLAFAGATGANPFSLPNLAERVEALLQAQLKAVKKLFQDHSEAVIAVAEALIDREELVADEIKALIDEADARRVAKTIISEFEPLLETGSNGNGHALTNGKSNGSLTPRIVESNPLNSEDTRRFPRAQQNDL
jgi:ATP-dependent Zn protease